MSNTDSFVDEVTDEVRRDRLFALFRKYGWIGVLVVVLIVGGAAWREWQKSVDATRAQSFGDAALVALEKTDPAERAAALAAIAADKDQLAIQALLTAGNPEGDKAARLAALDGLIADASAPQVYRDLAVLRRVSIAGTDQALADRPGGNREGPMAQFTANWAFASNQSLEMTHRLAWKQDAKPYSALFFGDVHRHNRQASTYAAWRYRVSKNWQWRVEGRYATSRDTVSLFTYSSSALSAMLEWEPR